MILGLSLIRAMKDFKDAFYMSNKTNTNYTIHATVVVNKVIINVDSECLLVSHVGWLASHVKAIV